ncbi:MAG: hypothetical protein D9V47_05335 [Clostridia bacterium]|nr:MAG: hypothetical protein D9V47_05335 [Clostridia bacterium]
MKKVAFYGKAGIGKSTTSTNVSAAVSLLGEKVAQVGCDPKHDSVANLMGGKLVPTIMDQVNKHHNRVTEEVINEVIYQGYNGILCAEAGGPRPGNGCAGKGVLLALQYIHKFQVLEKRNITFVCNCSATLCQLEK